MEDYAHKVASRAQKYLRGNNNPISSTQQDYGITADEPLSAKASTMGSVNQRTAWRTPKGASYSAQSRKSTLFDDDAPGITTVSRDN